DAEHLLDLVTHYIEHPVRRRTLGDERSDAPQRRLLVGELREFFVRLAVRDRGGDQLGELRETVLHVLGKGFIRGSRRGNKAPDPTVDDDRSAWSFGPAVLARLASEDAGEIGVVLEPYRAAGAHHFCRHCRAVEWPTGAGGKRGRMCATDREHGQRRAIVLIACD